jgi:hypothetical protein
LDLKLREEGALLAGAFGDGDGEKGGRIVGSLDGTAFLFIFLPLIIFLFFAVINLGKLQSNRGLNLGG